ncbi:MAG: lipid-A-disaccharide synthase [Planctomycetota bacterium]
MIWLQVGVTLVRELVRCGAAPLRLLLYLPNRRKWRQRAQDALAAASRTPAGDARDPLAAFFEAAPRPRAATPHLFVSAGEASGELHASKLVRALGGEVRASAFGGAALADAGARVRFGLSEHAVMGVVGVLRQLPLILRAYADFLRLLRDDRPDLVVLVDYPGLHLVMAKACRRRGVPVLHYIAPQYWAWGPWRMRRYRRAVDATLTILPFETEFFARQRVPAAYIGHPLLDELADAPPPAAEVARVRSRRTLVLLPGSRRAEIQANLAGMLRVAEAVRAADPDVRVVIPHKNPRRTEGIRAALRDLSAEHVEHHEGPLGPWLAGAHLVLAKSGTGSLEASLHGNPTVVVYQLRGWLAALGYRTILSVPFIAGANLIAGREVVPERCFAGPTGWRAVTEDTLRLWRDDDARRIHCEGLDEVRRRLGEPGATERVAAIVRRFLSHAARS